jgi:hypothetical protein
MVWLCNNPAQDSKDNFVGIWNKSSDRKLIQYHTFAVLPDHGEGTDFIIVYY